MASSHPPRAAAAVPPHVAEFVLFVRFFDLRRRHGLRKGQRQRVSVVGARLAALLHVGFRFQHQQVAPVDVIPRAREVGRELFVLVGRARRGLTALHLGIGPVRAPVTYELQGVEDEFQGERPVGGYVWQVT
jgi:hypothetical protein